MKINQNVSLQPIEVGFKGQTKNINSNNAQHVEGVVAKSPTGEVWQAMIGINPKDSNKLINKFALTGKLGLNDIKNLKQIIKQGDKQAENVSMLLKLVDEKTINPRTLRYVCKDGLMSDGMEKDIRMIFSAKANGTDPKDAYIPHVTSKEEGLKNVETGDMFEVEGQKNIFIKNKNGEAEQLKMDKDMVCKLFPPAERFANAQTYSQDCYFVSTVNSMLDNPNARPHLLQFFEQDGDDVKIKFPTSDFTYTAEDAKMPKAYKANFVTGSTGMKLIEYAYGKYLEELISNQARQMQVDAISDLEKKISTETDSKEKENLSGKLKNYQRVLTRFDEDRSRPTREYVVSLTSERKPEVLENEGILLRSLSQMNTYRQTSYQTAADYYRGDGGYMEDVLKDFGYKETKVYSMNEKEVKNILLDPNVNEKYIISGGTKNEGKQNPLRAELVMDKDLNMYGGHAYRISPSKDKNGNVVFKVSNPWNSSQNTILTMDKMEQFFSQIHIAKID